MTAKFTNSGEFWVTDLILGGASATDWHIGWGTGTATDVKADDDLGAAATEARVTATAIEETTASDTARWIGTLTAGTAKSIEEAGLFWDATGTTSKMLIRGTHSTVAVAISDQIRYTFTLEQT
jgi:hypothetical protein